MTNPQHTLHTDHSRHWRENTFVYPVLSRRSRGVSIGVNLNPDKVCNFDCIYCQVDRRSEAETRFVATEQLLTEIDAMLGYVSSGALFAEDPFSTVPPQLQRLNDIAFSGDGEPTTYRNIDQIVGEVAGLKKRHGLDDVKMVLITNASMFHRPACREALQILDANNGEIWAKLDAGTAEYYQLIERTKIPFQRILDNITEAARERPLVLQSLFMRVNGNPPSPEEIDAYCTRINEIQAAGGQLKLAQIYTVARPPAESFVSSLTDAEVDAIAEQVQRETGVPAECFYGG
ncbi:radical SAM protein [Symmachiella dynata]|uniref:radical SAM protein n=1 Tax=Symmachiella dynata TaxID=2527995 RepID=UPI0030EF03DA